MNQERLSDAISTTLAPNNPSGVAADSSTSSSNSNNNNSNINTFSSFLLSWECIGYLLLAILVQICIYIYFTRKRTKSIVGRHVVITGGSKGIGLCLAVECAMRGANVTVIARDEKMLSGAVALMEVIRQMPEQRFQYYCLDLAGSYEEVAGILASAEQSFGDIYMLINCAGLAVCGVFEEVPVADARRLMDINYWGSYHCARYVLAKMKKSREGILVFTASQAALFGIYGYGAYAASKYAVRGLAETIAMETRHLGIYVTLAMPSDTDTPGFENEEKTKPPETKIISGSGGLANPEQVAKRIMRDSLRGEFVSILGFESWLLTLLGGGLLRWGGVFQNLFHAIVLGPLRIVGCCLHLYFERIIRNCARSQ